MRNTHKHHSDDKWENGVLGASENHVRKVPRDQENAIDKALGLQVVSIRLQKELIEIYKQLAKEEGIVYQPLMRQVLTRYARESKQSRIPLKSIN